MTPTDLGHDCAQGTITVLHSAVDLHSAERRILLSARCPQMISNTTRPRTQISTKLLDVSFETSQKDIDRAWRRTALKYHPDKVGNDSVAKEKFHLAQIGYDLLSDPASKAIYDNARSARLQRKRQNELFEGRRKQMKENLEMRERGVKRPRDDGNDEEEMLQREIRRLAEDGKRRRKEREEALKRELERDGQSSEVAEPSDAPPKDDISTQPAQGVAEIDRTIKVRWPVEGDGGSITAERVKKVFSKFGNIESADLLNPKMLRLSTSKKKQLAVVCMIQYASVVGAHAAVADFSKQEGSQWAIFDTVSWASNKEPDFLSAQTKSEGSETPETPMTPANNGRTASNPFAFLQKSSTDARDSPALKDLGKKPSFASFSPASSYSTPKGSPFGKASNLGSSSPTLEEITMIRLKEAEKRRLIAEIQRQDEEADGAAETSKELSEETFNNV